MSPLAHDWKLLFTGTLLLGDILRISLIGKQRHVFTVKDAWIGLTVSSVMIFGLWW